jgi:hypothetical protein
MARIAHDADDLRAVSLVETALSDLHVLADPSHSATASVLRTR